jgi:hypothetical protein
MKLLEIYPFKEVSYEMSDDIFKVFHDLVKKTVAIKAPMTFSGIYENLPPELQQKITIVETERVVNDIRDFELISIQREGVEDGESNN